MRNKKIEEYKRKLYLTGRQKEILIGLILGDGHIENTYHITNVSRLKVEHSYKQRDYVDWLYKEFKDWVRSKPKKREVKVFGKIYQNYRFSTYSHRLLTDFRERFYNDREKIIPKDLQNDVTPLGMAVWYMDDGSIKSKAHKGLFLNTQGFNESGIKTLQRILKNKFGIISTTRKEKNGKQIYLGGRSGEKFIALVDPYIILSMRYKIPLVLRSTKLPKR